MSIASIRRALRPFACDRGSRDTAETDGSGPAPIDVRAQRAGRQTLREMAARSRGSLAQMMAGRALIDCGDEWWLARVRLVQTWRGPMPDLRRADALLAACGVPAGVQTDIFGRDEAETVEVER